MRWKSTLGRRVRLEFCLVVGSGMGFLLMGLVSFLCCLLGRWGFPFLELSTSREFKLMGLNEQFIWILMRVTKNTQRKTH